MLPQRLPTHLDGHGAVCAFAVKWTLSLQLAERLRELQVAFPFVIRIISGYRSPLQQQGEIDKPNSTAAPIDLSTHTSCPATGADLDVLWTELDAPIIGSVKIPVPYGMELAISHGAWTDSMKLFLGRAIEAHGMRWGGGAARVGGVPIGVEFRHADLGRRK